MQLCRTSPLLSQVILPQNIFLPNPAMVNMRFFMLVLGALIGSVSAATDGQADSESPFLDWHPRYGTGVIPAGLEAAVSAELGPRMFNAMFQNSTKLQTRDSSSNASDLELGGCFNCLFVVAKEMPCVYYAIKGGGFPALLQCGVGKADVCECVSCLPDTVSRYISGWCNSTEGNDVAATTELLHDSFVNSPDINVQAFLGTLTKSDLENVKRVVAAVPPKSQKRGLSSRKENPTSLGCVIGDGHCSGCSGCCVGACVLGACIGACV